MAIIEKAAATDSFTSVYKELNDEQKKAVNNFEGPMLVLAGPGTGKTQLLSARVANILRRTDTAPQNILCLTFTENGALNMRDRLSSFIGPAAYNVQISTYHAFGGNLIRRYPEYFTELRLESPIDELGKFQVVEDILQSLSYASPLKSLRRNVDDISSAISEFKRALLTPDQMRLIAEENNQFVSAVSPEIAQLCAGLKSFPSSLKTAEPLYSQIRQALIKHQPTNPTNSRYGSLAGLSLFELDQAAESAVEQGKSKPYTEWKNKWLDKASNNTFALSGQAAAAKLRAMADLLEQYQASLAARGWYDYDDMIARAVEALKNNDDLRYSLQEQHQYILLDEFQDTNAAQLELVELLTNNPLSEGRPNVMAVGDDDQAIYAFQGAQYSNMINFFNLYNGTELINLTDNYRSHADVLRTAANVAAQIDARLISHFPNMTKQLAAKNTKLPAKATFSRTELVSDIAEYGFIAGQIEQLIKSGTPPREIAVLAPKHKLLEALVPYLAARNIPVRYEKRENILEAPVVRQLITMARLTSALSKGDEALADSLWPEVLSYDFYEVDTDAIWQLSWQVSDQRSKARFNDKVKTTSWTRQLLNNSDKKLASIAEFYLRVAELAKLASGEQLLDYLLGSQPLPDKAGADSNVLSPLRQFYASEQRLTDQPALVYETLSQLTVLREHVSARQASAKQTLSLDDFIELADLYRAAEQPMLNTSPYQQQADAVQLMTVYKAKGLEFAHVFLTSCDDDTWGTKAKAKSNSLSLPANLVPIRHSGASDDERLRLLFVALTRAKFGLHLSSHQFKYNGKPTSRLAFFDEHEDETKQVKTRILPEANQLVTHSDKKQPPLELIELNWQSRHNTGLSQPKLRDLLAERLASYQLSPTHLNSFIDLVFAGPQQFLLSTLLKFPQAPSVTTQFGNAVHGTLEWLQLQLNKTNELPTNEAVIKRFEQNLISQKLPTDEHKLQLERGRRALKIYLQQRGNTFKAGDKPEFNCQSEGVVLGDMRLGGKIDKLEIDNEAKTIIVVDYKTGKGASKWGSDLKLYKYQQQLYCYKLLIENSHSWQGYEVIGGRLEFIDPNVQETIDYLPLNFNDKRLAETKQLLNAVWQRIMRCDFPDVSQYPANLTGLRQFEADLRDNKI